MAKLERDKIKNNVLRQGLKKKADILNSNSQNSKHESKGDYKYLEQYQGASRPGPKNQISQSEQEVIMSRERRTFTKNEFITAQPTRNDIFEIDWPKMDSLKCIQSG